MEHAMMGHATIEKVPRPGAAAPNLQDYEQARATFSWDTARQMMSGLPAGRGLNMAHEAVDRHLAAGHGEHLALRFLGKDGTRRDYTYAKLAAETAQFANLLRELGIGKGDRVFALLPRVPELMVSCLGTLKNGSVFSPLFSAFGPEPIALRLRLGDAKVLVTSSLLYARKVAAIRPSLPALRHILVVSSPGSAPAAGTLVLEEHLARQSTSFEIPATAAEDLALLFFTSGTTGRPKGAMHVHGAVVAHHVTGALALDFHPDDVFWCTADPGWVTGTSYGILSPLTHGITSIVDEQDFDAERWYGILRDEKVSVWYTAPTAVRMLMRGDSDVARQFDMPALRFIASVGEPLNPEAVRWGLDAFNLPIHDNWWQTETGGIMIANYAGLPVRPGSMGLPLPGVDAAIVQRAADGSVTVISEPGIDGELALRRGWPSMFRGYLNDAERYGRCFAGDWYLTGDLARRDADGYYWFVGRADDVIKSSGHLIGPFEVESALLEHPAVAEAGVIGKPDPTAFEVVKAFVALRPGQLPSEALGRELLGFARARLGAAIAPKEIAFVASLPRTRSGKIMRRLLKARELGLPEGDTSTLESPP